MTSFSCRCRLLALGGVVVAMLTTMDCSRDPHGKIVSQSDRGNLTEIARQTLPAAEAAEIAAAESRMRKFKTTDGVVGKTIGDLLADERALRSKVEPVYRAGKATQASLEVGLTPAKYRDLLQTFATEIKVMQDKSTTDDERKLAALFTSALTDYNAAATLWSWENMNRGKVYARKVEYANERRDQAFKESMVPDVSPPLDVKGIVERFTISLVSHTNHHPRRVSEFGPIYSSAEATITEWLMPEDSFKTIWLVANTRLDEAVSAYLGK